MALIWKITCIPESVRLSISSFRGFTSSSSTWLLLEGLGGGNNMNALNGILSEAEGTFGNNDLMQAPKLRKPYTVTKRREKWAEEEHTKFLEALQLYGRAWRRIEEHIGTKTSVQIGSHAQKFFSKVAREADVDVEIPPPRPKRKPNHLYPRKQIHPCGKETRVLAGLKDLSLVSPVSGDEDRTPTLVLSLPRSKNFGASFSNKPTSCSPLITSAAGSSEQGDRMQSPAVSDEEDDKHISQSDRTTTQCRSAVNQESDSSFEDSDKGSVQALKLFGRTVMVTKSGKHSPATADFASDTVKKRRESISDLDAGSSARIVRHEPYGGMFPMFHCFPSYEDASKLVAKAGTIPVPLWDFYPNLPFSVGNCREELTQFSVQNECSGTGSNTAAKSGNACDSLHGDQCGEKKVKPVEKDDAAFRRNQKAVGS